MKSIGPSFDDEIRAAGLAGLPFSWGADGDIQHGPAMTPAQRAQVATVYAAHDPTKPSPSAANEAASRQALLDIADRIEAGTATAQEARLVIAKLIRRIVR